MGLSSGRGVDLPYLDKDKQRESARRHYQKNREKMIARALEDKPKAKSKVRQIIFEHLAKNPCVDCGEDDPIVLEFDHRGDKHFNIGATVTKGIGVSKLIAEIAKCDIRCANCHRRKTYKEKGFTHRG